MVKHIFLSLFCIIAFILSVPISLVGQEKSVLVERCKALDQSSPIHNIWVDTNNIKWVANGNGLNKVLDLNYVEKVSVPAGITSLLMLRGGNAQLEWNTAEMDRMLGNATITCASYNPKTKTVWLGTKESGAYEISVSPLKIVQQFNTSNRKLTSNQINDIFIRNNGTIFIATNDGILTGSGNKWELEERYLNFIGVDAFGENVWILGDNFLWQVDLKGKWTPIAIELRNVEGRMSDIAVDDEGRVWIASNLMTGYDVKEDIYQRFGPGQYFTSQFVNCLDVDKDGSIWTGTADKGLYLIQWESSLIINFSLDNPLSCNTSEPNAILSAKVAGGEPPFTYVWSNGQATAKISQLAAGEYSLTVTDVNGLVKEGKYTIPDPAITASVQLITPASGSPQGDGSAKVIASGGMGQYMFAWDNGETNETAIKLTGGNHTVTVSDKSGCSTIATLEISETIQPLAVSITILNQTKCAGSPDGELRADVKGGKPPYLYAWSINQGSQQILTRVDGGTHLVTVTDAAGTEAIAQTVMPSPPSLSASISILSPALANTANGKAQAKASGGKAPYTFLWNNGETSATNSTLESGQTTVTITDANGCTSVAVSNMTETIVLMNAAIEQTGEIKCFDSGLVNLTATVTGGKAPYKYIWNNGQTTNSLNNLKGGLYQVTITDVTGSLVTVDHTVPQPDPITVTLQSDGAASTGGSDGRAIAKAAGGNGDYTYVWDNGETSNKAVKLTPGKHSITVTDKSGCTGTGEMEISENILALQASIEQVAEILCAGQPTASLKAVVTGGKEPYIYTWSNASADVAVTNVIDGLFTLTVTDATGHTATSAFALDAPLPLQLEIKAEAPASTNGNDGRAIATASGGKGKYAYLWDNGERSAKAEKLNAGLHALTITDENGCTLVKSIEISENILPLTVTINETGKISCAGQESASLAAEVSGGKDPFTYEWSGSGNKWNTKSISGVRAGTYTLQLSDATGVVKTEQYEIKEPKPLLVETGIISPASTGNADGEVTLKVSGGTLPYTFRNTNLPAGTFTITIDKLSPGDHTMVVTDGAGCTADVSFRITEDIQPLSVSIQEEKTISCSGLSDGMLHAVAKGGKSPYAFVWNNGKVGESITDVRAGKYAVTISDAANQKATIEYTVTEPTSMDVDIVNLRSATNDRINDGKGTLSVKGGAQPYAYVWSSGETTAQASSLPLGPGKVVITDQNGCTAVVEFTIKEKVLPELTQERLASGEPIRMEKIQFEADSININEEAIPSLNELYEFLYDHPVVIIEVAGHTNGLPADDYCDRISSERAQSVAQYLIDKGIESRRIISKGYGKRKPVATNQTPEGRKKNQRVEIRLIKIEE